MKVAPGTLVELDYALMDEEGELVEASAEEGPMVYVQGEGQVPPSLEEALAGQEPGARLELTLGPEEAFGPYDPEAIVSVPRADFAPDVELRPGQWIVVQVSAESEAPPETPGESGSADPADEEGEGELQARVIEVDDEAVVLDTNSPLAGKTVTFHVEVRDVRLPTPEDLRRMAAEEEDEDEDDA